MTPLLLIDGLVKRFGGVVATDQACIEVRPGEVHALIGPNGAGKTTLIHQISGALAPDAGRIVFDGQDVTGLAMPQRVLRGLARSYQITSIFRRLSVLDNLALAVQARSGSSFSFWRPARAERQRYEEAAAVAARIGLGHRLEAIAGALAHGEQRQLEVGLALATRPKLLLLDEPMAGMGPDESARMVELLQGLRQEVTLLLVEHDMDAVFRLADRVSTLVAGRVIACGTVDEIRGHPEVRRAYLGDEEVPA
ncbi:ABC transporter ATP-binding protein [Caldimonas thermodepolymerans]|jgi:ABC-type branched-chain amino acid transport systems, ATPase component|uniref:ABC transporter ATP-binding protein n=1 Tax=Caldimonas thermodepolymerans TaxID=215580 RepID=UPI002490C50A|nr:ABC transporter ATP-binding protein [Caldimonas thermodepolymerans]